MKIQSPIGYWSIDVPVTSEIVSRDMPILNRLISALPEEVSIRRMELVVEGRIWEWTQVGTWPSE